MLLAVRGARTRYEKDLKDKQRAGSLAEKRKCDEAVHVVSAKIRRLNDEANHLMKLADEKALQAERKRDFNLMAESNALRGSAKRKQAEAKEASQELERIRSA